MDKARKRNPIPRVRGKLVMRILIWGTALARIPSPIWVKIRTAITGAAISRSKDAFYSITSLLLSHLNLLSNVILRNEVTKNLGEGLLAPASPPDPLSKLKIVEGCVWFVWRWGNKKEGLAPLLDTRCLILPLIPPYEGGRLIFSPYKGR